MEHLDELIARLPQQHRNALEWFITHAGTEQPWPKALANGTLLVSKAQGIYKPSWTKYGLSIRQNMSGPYPDQEPVMRPDGTWSYLYSQEARDPNSRDSDYANRSLVACMTDRVPIGVIRQVSSKPTSRYRVLGLALIVGLQEGYFFLEGFSPYGQVHSRGSLAEIEALNVAQALEATGAFDPSSVADGREHTIASIVRRRGQPEYRQRLLEAYEGRCAITGCNAVEALEAVHIVPYRGAETNHPSNGLLLRADVHILFDLGLLAIDTSRMTVLISPSLLSTSYSWLSGRHLQLPRSWSLTPSVEALDQHRAWAGL